MEQHFGFFYEVERGKKLDISHILFKLCRADNRYCGNMRNHVTFWHLDLEENT